MALMNHRDIVMDLIESKDPSNANEHSQVQAGTPDVLDDINNIKLFNYSNAKVGESISADNASAVEPSGTQITVNRHETSAAHPQPNESHRLIRNLNPLEEVSHEQFYSF